jgi:signal transduction histidine kinase
MVRVGSSPLASWHDVSWLATALPVPAGFQGEVTLRVVGGSELAFLAGGGPLVDARGVPVGVMLVGALARTSEAREQVASQAMSMIAHELRNALTGVKGYAQIATQFQGDRQVSALAGLNRSIASLVTIVDQMLDVSRLDLGSFHLDRVVVNLVDLVRQSVEQHLLRPDAANLTFEVAEEALPVHCDPRCIALVLSNLLDNAVRYSPAGSPLIARVWRQQDEALFSVHDSGIGIPAADVERIFDRFYRAPDAQRLRADGLGLGLYVCRRLLALHGGRLWAESVPGLGSTFYFALALHESHER